ncbi:PQQ-dependent sugar dehydrogenase [Chryseolinea sp. T2]|uniref:PQQ-dependent sugar dehydrogenase n=1 Tax=Chryseolinea sp. T2 TaxID=3129255 RepID=UPI00307856A8
MKKYSLVSFIALLHLVTIAVKGQTYSAGFVQVQVANTIANPTAMAFAPDGRLFVAQQAGALRVIKNGALQATPFVTVSTTSTGERGLIGVTIDPDFAVNNWIYVYYTVPGSPAHNRISRFTANGDVALAGSEVTILELDPLSSATNHNGGAMHFGKDGKLFVAVGENANSAHAQNLDTYHGKLLRINKDGSVPAGNPFTTGTAQRQRVWSYGLRNPYTFSIHSTTGRILVNDVGQNAWEEVNDASVGGRNFGWPATEGNFNTATYPNYTTPIYFYSHASGDGTGCAITGGAFFNPSTTNYPSSYFDKYFIQDLCGAWINVLDVSTGAVRSSFATGIPGNALALTSSPDGNMYFLSRSGSAVYKIVYNNSTLPYITQQPQGATAAEGHPFSVSVIAAGSSPLAYQWYIDNATIEGATTSTYSVAKATLADAGQYTVRISNGSGAVNSNPVTIAVIANKPPAASIETPLSGTFYRAGDVINFSGRAVDEEDGPLSATNLRWNINFHHDTHQHDEPAVDGVASGSFTVPVEGETSPNVWYRIILTATDANGLKGKDSVDIHPLTSSITLATEPDGLTLTLDGQPVATPLVVESVVGLLRNIGAVTPQEGELVSYTFESWNDGVTETARTIATPDKDVTYVARFLSIVAVEERHRGLAAYPNPSRIGAIILRDNWQPPVKITMVDLLGRKVMDSSWPSLAGDVEQRFDFGKVRAGVYALIVEQNGSRSTIRIRVSD